MTRDDVYRAKTILNTIVYYEKIIATLTSDKLFELFPPKVEFGNGDSVVITEEIAPPFVEFMLKDCKAKLANLEKELEEI